MTTPAAPVWLAVDDVRAWLRVPPSDHADDDLITLCVLAAEPTVERARPDLWRIGDVVPGSPGERVYTPTGDVYLAAVQLAGRLVRRRNSPGGVETFADSLAYVANRDPDISRALWLGAYQYPGVG